MTTGPTFTEATSLARIFTVNGTAPTVLDRLGVQYPHLRGAALADAARSYIALQARRAHAETAPSAPTPGDLRKATEFQTQVNRAEADLTTATTQDLEAAIGARFG